MCVRGRAHVYSRMFCTRRSAVTVISPKKPNYSLNMGENVRAAGGEGKSTAPVQRRIRENTFYVCIVPVIDSLATMMHISLRHFEFVILYL